MSEAKIVIAVMLVETVDSKPIYFENVAIDIDVPVAALHQAQQWVAEQVTCAKMKATMGDYK